MSTAEIEPQEAASASALFNMMRNLGGSIGIAVCSTCVTQREQFHSSRVGESVTELSLQTRRAIAGLSSQIKHRGASSFIAHEQATKVLDNLVRREATVMAFNDTFLLLSIILFLTCISVTFLKKPRFDKDIPVAE